MSGLKPKKVEEPIVEEPVVEEVETEEVKPYAFKTVPESEPWTMAKEAKEVSLVKEKEEEEKIEELEKTAKTASINAKINASKNMNPGYQLFKKGAELYHKYFPKYEEEDVDDGLTTEEKQQKYEEAADKHGHDLYKNVESSWWNIGMDLLVKPGKPIWMREEEIEAAKRKWAGEKGVGLNAATGKVDEKILDKDIDAGLNVFESNYKNNAINKSTLLYQKEDGTTDLKAQQTNIEQKGKDSNLGLEYDQDIMEALDADDQELADKLAK